MTVNDDYLMRSATNTENGEYEMNSNDPSSTVQQDEWWANVESKRIRFGRWELYRDKRDWWIGVFLSERATYVGFLTLIAKRSRIP